MSTAATDICRFTGKLSIECDRNDKESLLFLLESVQKGCRIVSMHINFCGTQKCLVSVRDLLTRIQALQPRTAVTFSFCMTSSNAKLGGVLEGFGAVRLLDMFSNVICDEGMALLSRAIPSLETLRCLDLTSNLISPAGFARLAAALPRLRHLRRLRLGGNDLSDASMRHLAPALRSLRGTLTELDLNGNRLSPAGLRRLAAALAPLAALRSLDLSGCCAGRPVGDAAAALLAAAVRRLRRLDELLLYGTRLSDAAVAALAAALAGPPGGRRPRRRRLRHLGISGISPAARAALERLGRERGFAVTAEMGARDAPAGGCGRGYDADDGGGGDGGPA
jgi:hypothetical protein